MSVPRETEEKSACKRLRFGEKTRSELLEAQEHLSPASQPNPLAASPAFAPEAPPPLAVPAPVPENDDYDDDATVLMGNSAAELSEDEYAPSSPPMATKSKRVCAPFALVLSPERSSLHWQVVLPTDALRHHVPASAWSADPELENKDFETARKALLRHMQLPPSHGLSVPLYVADQLERVETKNDGPSLSTEQWQAKLRQMQQEQKIFHLPNVEIYEDANVRVTCRTVQLMLKEQDFSDLRFLKVRVVMQQRPRMPGVARTGILSIFPESTHFFLRIFYQDNTEGFSATLPAEHCRRCLP